MNGEQICKLDECDVDLEDALQTIMEDPYDEINVGQYNTCPESPCSNTASRKYVSLNKVDHRDIHWIQIRILFIMNTICNTIPSR